MNTTETPSGPNGVSALFGLDSAVETPPPIKEGQATSTEETTSPDLFGESSKEKPVPYHKNEEFKKVRNDLEAAKQEAKQAQVKLAEFEKAGGLIADCYSRFDDPAAAVINDYRRGEATFALKDHPTIKAAETLIQQFYKENPTPGGTKPMTTEDVKTVPATDPAVLAILKDSNDLKVEKWNTTLEILPKMQTLLADFIDTKHDGKTPLTKADYDNYGREFMSRYSLSAEDLTGKPSKAKSPPPTAGARNPSPAQEKQTSATDERKSNVRSFKDAKRELERKAAAMFRPSN